LFVGCREGLGNRQLRPIPTSTRPRPPCPTHPVAPRAPFLDRPARRRTLASGPRRPRASRLKPQHQPRPFRLAPCPPHSRAAALMQPKLPLSPQTYRPSRIGPPCRSFPPRTSIARPSPGKAPGGIIAQPQLGQAPGHLPNTRSIRATDATKQTAQLASSSPDLPHDVLAPLRRRPEHPVGAHDVHPTQQQRVETEQPHRRLQRHARRAVFPTLVGRTARKDQ
jgi:hypothetical protein